MKGGLKDRLHDAVIESWDAHQNMASQILNENRIKIGLANIVYDILYKGINSQSLKDI